MEVVSSEDTFEDSVWIPDKFWPVSGIGDDVDVCIVVSKFTKI